MVLLNCNFLLLEDGAILVLYTHLFLQLPSGLSTAYNRYGILLIFYSEHFSPSFLRRSGNFSHDVLYSTYFYDSWFS